MKTKGSDFVSNVLRATAGEYVHVGIVVKTDTAVRVWGMRGGAGIAALRKIPFRRRTENPSSFSDFEVEMQGKWHVVDEELLRRAKQMCTDSSSYHIDALPSFLEGALRVDVYHFDGFENLSDKMNTAMDWVEKNTSPITCGQWIDLLLHRNVPSNTEKLNGDGPVRFTCVNGVLYALQEMGLATIDKTRWVWGNKARVDVLKDSNIVTLQPHTLFRNIDVSNFNSEDLKAGGGGSNEYHRILRCAIRRHEQNTGVRDLAIRRQFNTLVLTSGGKKKKCARAIEQEHNIRRVDMRRTVNNLLVMGGANASSSPLVVVASFNVAGNVQRLVPSGSESVTVHRMLGAKAPRHGEYAARFMRNLGVDLLGVQEMRYNNAERFARFMGSNYKIHCQNWNHRTGFNGSACIWNSNTMPSVKPLTLGNTHSQIRSASAIYIPSRELVFVCIWLGHNGKKKEAFESLDLQTALGGQPVRRVILTTDSNDYDGSHLHGKPFRLLGFDMREPHGNNLRSCCEDQHFTYVGDYIFDSHPDLHTEYGIPRLPSRHDLDKKSKDKKQWTPKTQLMSDHLPVVLTTSCAVVQPTPSSPLPHADEDGITLQSGLRKVKGELYTEWANNHDVSINGIDAQDDQKLLIHAACQQVGTPTTSRTDSDGSNWKATVTMTSPIKGTYKGTRRVRVVPKASSSSGASSSSPNTFTLTTQNCLYTEHVAGSNRLSGWETEMIDKTQQYGKYKVTRSNLPWSKRMRRLNLKHKKAFPDILLLQECTEQMFRELNDRVLRNQYAGYHSKNGCCAKNDGYCWVAWKKNTFTGEKLFTGRNDGYSRYVGVKLQKRGSPAAAFVAVSTHLPASGSGPSVKMRNQLRNIALPVLVGGDFNMYSNPFGGLANLSGNANTFHNDETSKLDWVVGKGLSSSRVSVNPATGSRWPNQKEGSDHTAVRMRITHE